MITAIAPNGAIRWTFTEPSIGQGVIAGPTVGPDGNIYVVSDLGGLGAFALSPARAAALEQPGENPTLDERTARCRHRVRRRMLPVRRLRRVLRRPEHDLRPHAWRAPRQWARTLGGSDDMFMQQQRQPATGPGGSLYLTALNSTSGWSLFACGPDQWKRALAADAVPGERDVGTQRRAARARCTSRGASASWTRSVRPGQPRWTFTDGGIIDDPAVSPDSCSVVVAGNRADFGQPGAVPGWDAATGSLALEIDLGIENDGQPDPVLPIVVLRRQQHRLLRHRRAPAGPGRSLVRVRHRNGHQLQPPPPLPPSCVVPGVVGSGSPRPAPRSSPGAGQRRSPRPLASRSGWCWPEPGGRRHPPAGEPG